MRKITDRGARAIACAVLTVSVFALAALTFGNARTVSLTGGDDYAPIYHGDRSKARVAFAINVYENAEVVNKMLDLFTEKGVAATFFLGGCWADDNAETVRRIAECGMEIGNHGYFHKDCKKLDEDACFTEIKVCHDLVYSLCGSEPTLFAPPSGSYDDKTLRIAEKLGYKSIMWSKDTIDWRDNDESVLFRRATEGFLNGDIILMHPKPHTLSALGGIIDYYKEKNVEIVTVSDCL